MAELASRSMTAVTSVVSIVKEETVIALRCNTRGTEQITLPLVAIPLLVIAIVLISVGLGLPYWVKVDILQDVQGESDPLDRGTITFGLYRGEYKDFESRIGRETSDSYSLEDEYEDVPLERLYAARGLAYVAILLLVLAIIVSIYNTYQTVLHWWIGPQMIYILSFIAGLFGIAGMGVFLDFYLWEVNGDTVFADSTEFGHLLGDANYYTSTHVMYAFGIYVIGAVIPLIVTALAWRLVALLPDQQDDRGIENSPSMFGMTETPSSLYPGDRDPMAQVATEKERVLY